MTKKQGVINAIRDACPELKELSFGCEVLVKARNKGQTDFIGKVLRVSNNGFSLHRKYKQSVYLLRESISYEIIGHPPQLSHVLLALSKELQEHHTALLWSANYLVFKRKGIDERVIFDLTKSVEENLEENPDLLDFLHTLLNNK